MDSMSGMAAVVFVLLLYFWRFMGGLGKGNNQISCFSWIKDFTLIIEYLFLRS